MVHCTREIGSVLCKNRLVINLQMTTSKFRASDSIERRFSAVLFLVLGTSPFCHECVIYYLQHGDMEF